jgi:RNA polymerase sigma factor (sigma-70 family)
MDSEDRPESGRIVALTRILARRKRPHDRFEALMQPHIEALYGAARRMSRTSHDAEDLLQEVYVLAFERLAELELMEYPRAWLLRVMYNKFIDGRRKEQRSPLGHSTTGTESSEPDMTPADDGGPDELAQQDQDLQRILAAMRHLDSESCALVAMHDVEGYGIEELSTTTGLPAGTIKARLHRTRAKLGRLLKAQELGPPRLRIVGRKG